jgi:hypothetical protein
MHATLPTSRMGRRLTQWERSTQTAAAKMLCGRTRAATLNASPLRAARGAHRRASSGRTSRAQPRRVRPLSDSADAERNPLAEPASRIPSAEGWPCSQRSRPETGGIPDPPQDATLTRPQAQGPLQGQSFCGATRPHSTRDLTRAGATAQASASRPGFRRWTNTSSGRHATGAKSPPLSDTQAFFTDREFTPACNNE